MRRLGQAAPVPGLHTGHRHVVVVVVDGRLPIVMERSAQLTGRTAHREVEGDHRRARHQP